jgi:ubiquitin-like 1-activating enzyme E1 A
LDRLKSLNPRVDIVVSKDTVMEASAEFYNSFDIVCMSGCNPLEMIHVNKICHSGKVKFFAAENIGFHSYIFSDLIEHSFSTEMKRTGYGKEEIVKNTRTDTFESLDVVMKRKFGFASEKSMRKWKRVAHPLYFALLGYSKAKISPLEILSF